MEAPEIRLQGFTEPWEQWELSEIVTSLIRGPFGGSLKKETFVEDGYRVYEQQDAIYGLDAVARYYIPEEKYNEMIRFSVNDGDFLISCSGTIGRIYRLPKNSPKGIINQALLKITVNESKICPDYFIQYFRWENFQKTVIDDTQGGAIKNLVGMDKFRRIIIKAPCINEQRKLGEFFRALDETIFLCQQKLDSLKTLKKGYLQQMFPQTGETVPRVRFKGFTEPWEQRKLGDIADIVRGASPRPIQDPIWFDNNSDVGWLRISDVTEQNGRIRYLEQKISSAGQEKTRVLTKPHLLLSIAATVGKPVINYIKTGVHDGFLIFMNPQFEQEFMFHWLEMFREQWYQYGQTGSQINLNSDLVKAQEIIMPQIEEQTAIGNFFHNIDNQITTQTQKLEQLKQLKSAYLQKMFV